MASIGNIKIYIETALVEENKKLREALRPLAECHLPPEGFEQHGVTAHFTTAQIIAAKNAMPPNVELRGRAL